MNRVSLGNIVTNGMQILGVAGTNAAATFRKDDASTKLVNSIDESVVNTRRTRVKNNEQINYGKNKSEPWKRVVDTLRESGTKVVFDEEGEPHLQRICSPQTDSINRNISTWSNFYKELSKLSKEGDDDNADL